MYPCQVVLDVLDFFLQENMFKFLYCLYLWCLNIHMIIISNTLKILNFSLKENRRTFNNEPFLENGQCSIDFEAIYRVESCHHENSLGSCFWAT